MLDYVRFFKHSIVRSACIITYQPEYGSIRQFNEDQEKIYFADAAVFRMFTYSLLKGSPDHALRDPNTVALSESAAMRYFGDQDPMGKMLKIENRFDARISGVIKEAPPCHELTRAVRYLFTLNSPVNPSSTPTYTV